ncbi:Error-prone DNA polymerase [Stutzerimonas stutzeri]
MPPSGGGWPEAALSEILLAAPGTGELRLLWPTLARLTVAGERVVLVDPPHLPYPQAWLTAGVDLRQLSIVHASGRDALWATEQCLRYSPRLQAANDSGVPLIVGSEFAQFENGPRLILLVENLTGYQALCRLITLARRRCEKGRYRLLLDDFAEPPDGLLAIWLPDDDDDRHLPWLLRLFPQRLWLAVELHRGADDAAQLQHLLERATSCGLPPVARRRAHARPRTACPAGLHDRHPPPPAGGRGRRPSVPQRRAPSAAPRGAGRAVSAGPARRNPAHRRALHLRSRPVALSLPARPVLHGHDATSWLRELVERGARWRWPDGVPEQARRLLEHELKLIAELAYESYFLTVHDIVNWARERQILCQGRGSAANSTVCFALGITELDPTLPGRRLLFERFLSRERKEPPDIDVDFEHERREEVIQYVFSRYGRHRAALTAVVSTYHSAGALRDVAKALGLPADQVNALADCCGRWSDRVPSAERLDRLRCEQPFAAPGAGTDRRADRLPPSPVAASWRFRDQRTPTADPGAGGERQHGRAHGDPVGQGRPRSGRPAQSRCAGPGQCQARCAAAST